MCEAKMNGILKVFVLCCVLAFAYGFQRPPSIFRISDFKCSTEDGKINVTWSVYVQPRNALNTMVSHYVISWYDVDNVTSPQYEGEDADGESLRQKLSGQLNGTGYDDYPDTIENMQENIGYRSLKTRRTYYAIKNLPPMRYMNVALRAIPRPDVTSDDVKWFKTCIQQSGEGVPSPPRNVTVKAVAKTKVRLAWLTPLRTNSRFIKNYLIQHRFANTEEITNTTTKNRAANAVVSGLQSHSIYEFRVAAVNSRFTGEFSEWVRLPLDVKQVDFSVVLTTLDHKRKFQKSLKRIMPLAYLGYVEGRTVNMKNGNYKVYYHLSFEMGVNITHRAIEGIFALNWVQELLSYTVRLRAQENAPCKEETVCDKKATCVDMTGTYRCECPPDTIDNGSMGYKFPGMECVANTGPPGSLFVNLVSPNVVKMRFRRPSHVAGRILHYDLEKRSLSNEEGAEMTKIIGTKRQVTAEVTDLSSNSVYEFRVRAITSVKAGSWSPWKRISTVCFAYELTFAFTLAENIDDYQAMRDEAHGKIDQFVLSKVSLVRGVTVTHHQVEASNFVGDGSVRVQGVLYTKPPAGKQDGNDLLRTLQTSFERLLATGFDPGLGIIDGRTIYVTDINECGTPMEDCHGNQCVNLPGTFTCRCPQNNIDVSDDYKLLRGRKCQRFDAPTSFSVSLIDPRSSMMSWKIPLQMRKKELRFWFYIQWRKKGESSSLKTRKVEVGDGNFTAEDFVMTKKVRNLRMNSIYEFRVVAANMRDNGTFTTWKSLKTSNFIFVATLNLTAILYTQDMADSEHPRAVETADLVRKLMDRILINHITQYMATGKVDFIPGNDDRTFAVANLFFDSKARVEMQQIRHSFKHSTVREDHLGLDMDAVSITDFDECNTTWEDCSAHAQCTNLEPGYKCTCKDDYIDRSEHNKLLPGRICMTEDELTTTPVDAQPTRVTFSSRSTTEVPLPLPGVEISGDAIGPNTIRLTWRRLLPPSGGSEGDLDYVFQYRIKKAKNWTEVSAPATLAHFNIGNLRRRNIVYEVRVAERWSGKTKLHTSFSFPIQVRTTTKTYRLYLRLPTVPSPGPTSPLTQQEVAQAKSIVEDYVRRIFTNKEVLLKHASVKFGSVGNVELLPHPDRGAIASMLVFFTLKSTGMINLIERAYRAGEEQVKANWPIHFFTLDDVDECLIKSLRDCHPAADCLNTNGDYQCSCRKGYVDGGGLYHLLRGRHCVALDPPTRATPVAAFPTFTSTSPQRLNQQPKPTSETRYTTQKVTESSPNSKQETNTPSTSDCLKGQMKVAGFCKDVLTFPGEVVVMEMSGVNISQTMGQGDSPVKNGVRAALRHAFTSLLGKKKLIDVTVDKLLLRHKLRVSFTLVLESANNNANRRKRQLDFEFNFDDLLKQSLKPTGSTTDKQSTNSRALQADIKAYLKKLSPQGVVSTGSSNPNVTFDTQNVVIRDVNECKSVKTMTDCDAKKAFCYNTEGSFTCQCKPSMRDENPTRPGRICKDQCDPDPCYNGGECSASTGVGGAVCICTDEYEGEFCEVKKTQDNGQNTVMMALLAVGGALFVVMICLIASCLAHRRNKRRKRRNMEKSKPEASDVGTQQNFDIRMPQPNPKRPYLAKTQVIGSNPTRNHVTRRDLTDDEIPPTIPTRTTSLKPRPAPRHRPVTSDDRPRARSPCDARTTSYENTIVTSQRSASRLSSDSTSSFESDYDSESENERK